MITFIVGFVSGAVVATFKQPVQDFIINTYTKYKNK